MPGKDIYWYGVQAKSLLHTGKLHSPDSSPVFSIVEFLFRIFGETESTLFLFGFITYGFLVLSGRIGIRFHSKSIRTENRIGFPFFLFLSGIWISFLYPKQAWGLGFFGMGIGFWTGLLHLKERRIGKLSYLITALACFGISIWFHSVFLILSVCIPIGIALNYLALKKALDFSKGFLIAFSFIVLLFILRILLPDLSFSERWKFDSDFYFPILETYRSFGSALLLEWFLVFFLLWRRRTSVFYLCLLAAFLFPWASFTDLQFRIFLSVLWISELSIEGKKTDPWWGLLVCMLWILGLRSDSTHFRHNYPEFRKALHSLPNDFRPGLLVAHHGFCEFIKFHRELDCLSWKPDEKAKQELPSGSEIYRIVQGFSSRELENSFDSNGGSIFKNGVLNLGDYLLVKERDWDSFRSIKEKERDEEVLSRIENWRNPFRTRPKFILKKYGKPE